MIISLIEPKNIKKYLKKTRFVVRQPEIIGLLQRRPELFPINRKGLTCPRVSRLESLKLGTHTHTHTDAFEVRAWRASPAPSSAVHIQAHWGNQQLLRAPLQVSLLTYVRVRFMYVARTVQHVELTGTRSRPRPVHRVE